VGRLGLGLDTLVQRGVTRVRGQLPGTQRENQLDVAGAQPSLDELRQQVGCLGGWRMLLHTSESAESFDGF